MSMIIGIVAFALVLGIIVLVHEFGHFITAKLFGVYCGEFAIGMGPTVFSKQGKETKYAIRLLPIGGFVSMAGEAEGDDQFKDVPKARTIKGIAVYKRVIIMAAGATMNLILAWVLLLGVSALAPIPNVTSNQIRIVADMPAESYLQDRDTITAIEVNGVVTPITSYKELIDALPTDGTEVTFDVLRDGQKSQVTFSPKQITENNETRFAYGLTPTSFNETLFGNVQYANTKFIELSQLIVQTLSRLITNPVTTSENLSGPIGIFQVINRTANQGVVDLMFLTALLSVNIGIFNLLPVPILDGGRIVLEIYSGITKKPISEKVESTLMYIGIGLIALLLLVATWNDIVRLFQGLFG